MFTRQQFFGLSIVSFTESMGWNHQASQLNVRLVLDPQNGDFVGFTDADLGKPAYFYFGPHTFFGILQKIDEVGSESGFPLYEAVLTDPRDLLDGAKVILGGYSGSVGAVPNLLNAFGYWENIGFGASLAGEAGIPWAQVLSAVLTLTNTPGGTIYGGPLTYRGFSYSLDLSQMPSLPASYMISGGHSASLLELISRVCEDAGCDFFVELVGLQIRVRSVSRLNQPPLGTIAALVTSGYGATLSRYSKGGEFRNEPTSSFLTGGEVTTLYQTPSITSFWGYNTAGDPILGVPGTFDIIDNRYAGFLPSPVSATVTTFFMDVGPTASQFRWPDPPFYIKIDSEILLVTAVNTSLLGFTDVQLTVSRGQLGTVAASHGVGRLCYLLYQSVPCEYMDLNAEPVQDILNSTSYSCSTLEMRLAKVSFEAWSSFVVSQLPVIANQIGLTSLIRNKIGVGGGAPPDLINDKNAAQFSLTSVQGDLHAREMRMYEFVRSYANTYMGHKYAVGLPFVLSRQDPSTLRVTTSYDIADGGYLPEGSSPLGLSLLNEDIFKTQDGRFRCFTVHNVNPIGGVNADLSHVNPQGTVIENGNLYMDAQVDQNIIFTPNPAAVVTLKEPVFDQAIDTIGNFDIIRAILQMPAEQARKVLNNAAFGTLGIRIHPAHRNPLSVAIPLKSNIATYGPWYRSGVAGKVTVEQDPSLTPWNFGGYAGMNAAATARVNDAVTNMQVSEQGSLEMVGPPTYNLGDILYTGGPNITNIEVSFGERVTTTYRFQTYTQRLPGLFTKIQADKIRTIGRTTSELRRAQRGVARLAASQAVPNVANTSRDFLLNAPKAIKQESPSEVLIAHTYFEGSGNSQMPPLEPGPYAFPGSGYVRVGASVTTFKEAMVMSKAGDDGYASTAMMSMNGLVRPFSVAPNGGTLMSSMEVPSIDCELNASNLNPWRGPNDIEVYAYGSGGSQFQGLHAFRWQLQEGINPHEEARPLSLRGPLVITGWGYDMEGRPCPSGGDGGFAPRHLYHSEQWKTGPVDLLWDDRRKVWSCHDIVFGEIVSSGLMRVDEGYDIPLGRIVGTWASGDAAFGFYLANKNQWYAMTPTFSISSGSMCPTWILNI